MTHDEARLLLDAIQEKQYKGTKWEENFIASIEGWIEDGKRISSGQSATLQQIYRQSQGG